MHPVTPGSWLTRLWLVLSQQPCHFQAQELVRHMCFPSNPVTLRSWSARLTSSTSSLSSSCHHIVIFVIIKLASSQASRLAGACFRRQRKGWALPACIPTRCPPPFRCLHVLGQAGRQGGETVLDFLVVLLLPSFSSFRSNVGSSFAQEGAANRITRIP